MAGAWIVAVRAGGRATAKTVSGTVSCATSQGSLHITAYAYRPADGYASAAVYTGPPDTGLTTGAVFPLLSVETDRSDFILGGGCSRTEKPVRFGHRGLRSAGVAKAGYNQWPQVYCGAPSHVFIRYRLHFDRSGKPARATMAVWARSKKSPQLRETGYVEWSRNRSVSYYSPARCVSQYY